MTLILNSPYTSPDSCGSIERTHHLSVGPMFKTASFKLHNLSKHKQAALDCALRNYHMTVKQAIETSLADPNLGGRVSLADKRGNLRPNGFLLQKEIRKTVPKGISIARLRDYAIVDAASMILSYLAKQRKGDKTVQPPTLPFLSAPDEKQITASMRVFCETISYPIKERHQQIISDLEEKGDCRVAKRMAKVFGAWATTKATVQMLRSTEVPSPHPIEFTRCELERGFMLARQGSRYFALLKIFASASRFKNDYVLQDGFVDLSTGEDLSGKKYSGFIVPLELGREHHEKQFIEKGRPRSAKLIRRKGEYYLNIVFEFTPQPIETQTVIGLDRGAAMIGAATVLDRDGKVLDRIDLHGHSFAEAMADYRKRIAEAQKAGRRTFNFKLRGLRSENIIGEYANRLVHKAIEYKSQVVLESLDGRAFGRFLKQSQIAKLQQKLTYKLECEGLPSPVEVPAAYTSQTCARCGHKARENRATQDEFLCVSCGYRRNADENASEVIGLRGLHQVQKGGRYQKFDAFQVWLKGQRGTDPSAMTG
jgi:hypothetical protein